MSIRDEIKKELYALLTEQGEITQTIFKPDSGVPFGTAYQRWYTRALKIVEALAPDRLGEFVGHYMPDPKRKTVDVLTYRIQDFTRGLAAKPERDGTKAFDEKQITSIGVVNQAQILAAVASRLDSVLADVTGALFAELQDSELKAASDLLPISVRAGGALAGVVLERHLQQVATNHKVAVAKKNPTIADLNDPLKTGNVYDLATWRKIQFLADIRNLCSHQKAIEPTMDQAKELISGVNGIIKTVF
jgi:hypothetical protein